MRDVWAILMSALCIGTMPSQALAQEGGIEQAMRLGSALFWYDRAAWVTSDDIVSRLAPDRHSEVAGWIVVPRANGYHVYFHGKDDAADHIVYEADVVGNQISNARIWPKAGAPELAGEPLMMANALRTAWREIAKRGDWKPCANARFNTIVLPPAADGSVPIYFLTPQTVANSFPFGGHFEIVISADGSVASSRRFTNSCVTITKGPTPSGATPAAMFLSHLLDPRPTEIHVFQQYAIGVPLYVAIQSTKAIWKVENGEVTLAGPSK